MSSLQEIVRKLHPVESGYDMIRIGYPHDGGYLIPNALDGIRYAYAPGVGGTTLLEDQLASRGIECFLVDGEHPRPTFTYKNLIHWEQKFLRAEDSNDAYSLDTWKYKTIGDYAGDLFLQMDIEGSEYEVLASVSESVLNQFKIMVVEFHEMQVLRNGTWLNVFEKLCEYFHVVHLHPNNFKGSEYNTVVGDIVIPNTMEITFINKRATVSSNPLPVTKFPHASDINNDPYQSSNDLPQCWYL